MRATLAGERAGAGQPRWRAEPSLGISLGKREPAPDTALETPLLPKAKTLAAASASFAGNEPLHPSRGAAFWQGGQITRQVPVPCAAAGLCPDPEPKTVSCMRE